MQAYLDNYLMRWQLRDPHVLATTPTSTVYRVQQHGADVVLKLLTDIGADDECGAPAALQHFAGDGAVRLLAHDERAHLLEYIAGGDLLSLAADDDTAATRIIAQVINRLHRRETMRDTSGLRSLRRRFRQLFVYAEHTPDAIYSRAATLAEALLSAPREVRVLHGDVHHANIRYSQRGWLAIDPKGLLGERTFDTANTFYNPTQGVRRDDPARIAATASVFAEVTGIERERILQFAFVYGCLSAAWGRDDADDDPPEWIATTLRTAHIIAEML